MWQVIECQILAGTVAGKRVNRGYRGDPGFFASSQTNNWPIVKDHIPEILAAY